MTNQEQKSRPFTAKSIMNLLVGSFFLLTFNSEAQIKTYEVVFNSSAPVLDGVRSPGEWDKASEAASDFKLLRTGGTESSENIQFQLLWNDEGLYMIAETDNTSWGDWGGNVDFGFDDYNIFIDPNDDDEPNEGSSVSYTHLRAHETR